MGLRIGIFNLLHFIEYRQGEVDRVELVDIP